MEQVEALRCDIAKCIIPLPQVQETVRNSGENVSLLIMPDAGHVCNVDNKNFFNRCSLDFLKNF